MKTKVLENRRTIWHRLLNAYLFVYVIIISQDKKILNIKQNSEWLSDGFCLVHALPLSPLISHSKGVGTPSPYYFLCFFFSFANINFVLGFIQSTIVSYVQLQYWYGVDIESRGRIELEHSAGLKFLWSDKPHAASVQFWNFFPDSRTVRIMFLSLIWLARFARVHLNLCWVCDHTRKYR